MVGSRIWIAHWNTCIERISTHLRMHARHWFHRSFGQNFGCCLFFEEKLLDFDAKLGHLFWDFKYIFGTFIATFFRRRFVKLTSKITCLSNFFFALVVVLLPRHIDTPLILLLTAFVILPLWLGSSILESNINIGQTYCVIDHLGWNVVLLFEQVHAIIVEHFVVHGLVIVFKGIQNALDVLQPHLSNVGVLF